MVECSVCGEDQVLPFRCSYCHNYYCSRHHLPENHECEQLWRARRPERDYVSWSPGEGGIPVPARRPSRSYSWRPQTPRRVRFSSTEVKHLAAGTLLVTAVGLTWIGPMIGLSLNTPILLAVSAALFGFSFMVHELAHKFMAQRRGMWAEFRMDPFGAMITLISLISPIKLIAPGAVVIAGSSGTRGVGETAAAGPITNIVLAAILTVASFPIGGVWGRVMSVGALLNAFLAVFNLVPFGVLDGYKIFSWDKKIWVGLFGISLLLLIYLF